LVDRRLPYVIGSELALPPHASRRAGGHVIGAERAVLLGVPLGCDLRVTQTQ
jgi:hypothetical protein